MRHDRCAEDSRGDQHGFRAVEPRYEEVRDDSLRVRLREDDLEREGNDDHADHPGDHGLEPAEPVALQGQDPEGPGPGEQAGREKRHPEQEVEAERGAEHLREVGRHRDRLGLDPERDRHGAAEVVATGLRQVPPGRDAELRRERLHEHRHQVRGEDDPQKEVAVLGAAGDVRREVAGVDVGNRGDERRPEERPETA